MNNITDPYTRSITIHAHRIGYQVERQARCWVLTATIQSPTRSATIVVGVYDTHRAAQSAFVEATTTQHVTTTGKSIAKGTA